jgi:hypothetical protein
VRRETDKPKTRGRLQRLCVRRGIPLATHLLKTPSEVDCKSLSCQLKKRRGIVLCAHTAVRVCVSGNIYLYHHKVVPAKGSRNVHRVTSEKKGGTVTLITCSNAAGNFLSPYCVCKGKRKKNKFEDGMPPGSRVLVNETSGYVTTVLFID